MPHRPRRALAAIDPCRTDARGGQVSDGATGPDSPSRDHAGQHRPGPTGQHGSAHAWLPRHTEWRLPGPHVLVPFPWPAALRDLPRRHPKRFDHRLVRASAPALHDLALAPRCVGGTIGLGGGWPPWTRARHDPPPGPARGPAGGRASDGRQCRPSRAHVLGPVTALARLVRANVRHAGRKPPVFDLVPHDLWAQAGGVPGDPVGPGSPA
jgi:hypothetical protein